VAVKLEVTTTAHIVSVVTIVMPIGYLGSIESLPVAARVPGYLTIATSEVAS
jgi:hypothetical protein